MPLFRFFRRRREQAPAAVAAPAPNEALETKQRPPTEAAPQTEKPKPKRRRGTRGGRGRRQGEPRAVERRDAADDSKKERKPERGRQQRQRRATQPPRRLPAAKRELLVSVDAGEQRVAVLEDGKLAEVYLERPERRSIAGNIYKGTVENVLPGMEAAFVEIGLEKNGFLFVDEIVVPELEGKRHGRKIQDLLKRNQEILVQAVKDPMKGKGARLTTEISLAGRFLVYVPSGEGIGVSRRLEDNERVRLRDILKALDLPPGGVIVRTAAEGASAEDVAADLVFLQRLWKSILAHADEAPSPALVYQEAELPLRVIRDLFTEDFERAFVDDDRTFKRIAGYLKKTSPHMVERVQRYREKAPLLEHYGVDAEIRSTLSPRVDLPSGGYLVFDYAEAFTVIDVNTGRFTGSRSKSSTQKLEDTITKNNLEAVREVVRQLRLRDIGGIIVIDFIDMANPRNRAQVEEALRTELERDRTKTYVVEISPLGLVEMTRQNVTEGPREILTDRCSTCEGTGVVFSAASTAIEIERQLRAFAASRPRSQAFRVGINANVYELLVGSAGERLAAIEERTRRRFILEPRQNVPHDYFEVVRHGKRADILPQAPFAEGEERDVRLVEVAAGDASSAVGRMDGYQVSVPGASKLVGKKVRVRLDRILDGTAFATLVKPAPLALAPPPITAEGEAEKPTRARKRATAEADIATEGEPKKPARRTRKRPPVKSETEKAPEAEPVEAVAEAAVADVTAVGSGTAEDDEPKPKRKTRRGSRGGRGRKKKPATPVVEAAPADGAAEVEEAPSTRIHVPAPDLGAAAAVSENGEQADAKRSVRASGPGEGARGNREVPPGSADAEAKPKKKTRRGSRGGRRRRKPAAVSAEQTDGQTES